MAGNQVSIKITADDQASKKIKGVGDEAESAGRRIKNALGDVAKIAGGIMVAEGLSKLPGLMSGAVSAASNLAESQNKVNAVFKESAGTISEWAQGAARDFGQSNQQALDAAGAFGNMFVQLGFARGAAADMSMTMTELASDFASFHNADISDVLLAQQAAFRGEYDALQRFVPMINAAMVETQALAETGKENAKQLTAQEKAAAVFTLMMQGAGDAVGDFDATAGGLANTNRILESSVEDLKAKLGAELLPVQLAVTKAILDAIPVVEDLAGSLADTLGPAIARVTQAWEQEYGPALDNAIEGTRRAIQDMRENWDTIGPIVEAALAPVFSVFYVFKSQLGFLGDTIRGFVALLRGDWSNAWKLFANAGLSAIQGMVNPIIDGFNMLIDAYNATIGRITGKVSDIPKFTFRFDVDLAPVYTQLDAAQNALDGALDSIKRDSAAIPPAAAEGIRSGGGGGGGGVREAVQDEIVDPILDEIIDLAKYATEAFAAINTGFAEELRKSQLGSVGYSLMTSLEEALVTGSQKALGVVGGLAAALIEQLKEDEGLTAEQAQAFGNKLMTTLAKVIESGGREGLDALHALLAEIAAELTDSDEAEEVFDAAKAFGEALVEAMGLEALQDEIGNVGAGIIEDLKRGIEEEDEGALQAAARAVAGIIDEMQHELGSIDAQRLGGQLQDLLAKAIADGGGVALEELRKLLKEINDKVEAAKGLYKSLPSGVTADMAAVAAAAGFDINNLTAAQMQYLGGQAMSNMLATRPEGMSAADFTALSFAANNGIASGLAGIGQIQGSREIVTPDGTVIQTGMGGGMGDNNVITVNVYGPVYGQSIQEFARLLQREFELIMA